MNFSCWIFSSTFDNWQIARKNEIWATRTENAARKVRKEDYVILYVVGTEAFCSVLRVAKDWRSSEDIVWADEQVEGKIMYPFRTSARVVSEGLAKVKELVPKLMFIENKQRWSIYFRGTPGNFGRPIPEQDFELICETMEANPLPADIASIVEQKLERKASEKLVMEKRQPVGVLTPKHNVIRDMIAEIGTLEGRITETEYPIDNLRLDVVWKRIKTGSPEKAFEVQLAGNFYEALTKLKHAWDKWNSTPFLVTTSDFEAQAKSLLEGSFHEIRKEARIVNWKKIVELHQLLKHVDELKSDIRL